MYYQKRISNCKICNDEYEQVRELYVLCKKPECKTKNRALNKKIYTKKLSNGEKIIRCDKPKITDTSMPEVRFKNIFILGQYNACSFR